MSKFITLYPVIMSGSASRRKDAHLSRSSVSFSNQRTYKAKQIKPNNMKGLRLDARAELWDSLCICDLGVNVFGDVRTE